MVSNVSHAIDLAIDKKINQSVVEKRRLKDFVKYAKSGIITRKQFSASFEYFLDYDTPKIQKDVYNNKLHDYLKIKKTKCKFNLIKLFTPGELLSSVCS